MKIKKGISILSACILGLFFFFVFKNKIEVISSFSIIIFLFSLCSFYFFDKLFKLDFRGIHYFFVIFISIGFLFGFLNFYIFFMDKIMHFIGGIMLASIIFHILQKFKIQKTMDNHRRLFFGCSEILFFTLLICLAIILSWEFFEYILDNFFGYHMRGVFSFVNGGYKIIMSPFYDTISDIISGMSGTLIYLWRKSKSTLL